MGVEIVLGAAGCAKEDLFYSRIIEKIENSRADEILILVTTNEIRKNLPENILKSNYLKAFEIPDIKTFDNLAESIVKLSPDRIGKISPLSSSFLMRQIIKKRTKKGQLAEYSATAEFQGFYNYVINFIYTLKQSMIAPEDIEKNEGYKTAEPRLRELVGIYRDYQEYLHMKKLYDDSGVFWRALEVLQHAGSELLGRYRTIFIYGFTSFTYLQKRIMRELINTIPEAALFLDYEEDAERSDLFSDPQEILNFLQQFNPNTRSMKPGSVKMRYSHLERNLFRTTPVTDSDAPVPGLFCAPDTAMEADAIAVKIKRLLIDKNLSPDEVAVVIPGIELYADNINTAFKKAGIPFSLQSRQVITDTPLGNYLMHFMRAAFSDLPRAEFKSIVNSNYFYRFYINLSGGKEEEGKPDKISPCSLSYSAASIIESSGVISGITSWEQYLKSISDKSKEEVEGAVSGTLAELVSYIKILRSAKDINRAADLMHKLLIKLRPCYIKDDYVNPLDYKMEIITFNRFFDLFKRDLQRLEGSAISAGSDNLYEILNFIIGNVRLPAMLRLTGAATVTNPYDFRGMKVKALFFAGLNRGSFPIYQNAARRIPFYNLLVDLNSDFKNRLPRQLEMAEDQMILFYNTLCSASEYIFLSWVQNDEESRSVFINDVLNIYKSADVANVMPAEITGETGRATNTAALYQSIILRKRPIHSKAPNNNSREKKNINPAGQLKKRLSKINWIIDRSNIENLRESPAYPDNFDGVMENDHVIEKIRRRFHGGFQYTASMFSDFGFCPFYFLAKDILKLETPEEKTEAGTPMDEGLFYHTVLQKFYSEVFDKEDNKGAFEILLDIESHFKRLDELIDAEFDRIEKTSRVLTGSYWSIIKESYRENIKRFIKYDIGEMGNSSPVMFEAGFGDIRKREEIDPASTSAPLRIQNEGNNKKINLAGIIDRVDISENEEGDAIRVIDYKSSGHTGAKDLLYGADFQLQLYALAARHLLGSNKSNDAVISAMYASIKKVGFKKLVELANGNLKIIYNKKKIDFSRHLRSYLFAYAGRINAGFFPPFPNRNKCSWCRMRPLCRYNPRRILFKLVNNNFEVIK